MNKETYKTAFKKALDTRRLTVYFQRSDYFILIHGGDSSRIVSVQLVCSTKIDTMLHGSHNNTEIQSIGHFKFYIPIWQEKTNFYIFAFPVNNEVEFVIVSDEVLRSRFQKLNRIQTGRKKAELTLWLMPDGCLYDCTNISAEGEWYNLSSGVDGRRADDSEWDYTKYLKNWQELVGTFGI